MFGGPFVLHLIAWVLERQSFPFARVIHRENGGKTRGMEGPARCLNPLLELFQMGYTQ